VNIDGATIQRATLNNVAFIEAMDLSIGDIVHVIRSGDIIPQIVGKD
jgi:DNA ligase (NAD+)